MTFHSSFDRSLLPPPEAFFHDNVRGFRARGRRATGLCPFHPDKNPSLSIDLDRGLWNCFACAEGGDVLTFVMRRDGISFKQAAQSLGATRDLPFKERNRLRQEREQRKIRDTARQETAKLERITAREHLHAVETLYREAITEHDWALMGELLPRVRQAETHYAQLAGLERSCEF
jgi:DNA primase